MANAAAVATEAYFGFARTVQIEKDPAKIAELNAKATFPKAPGFLPHDDVSLWQRETFQTRGPTICAPRREKSWYCI